MSDAAPRLPGSIRACLFDLDGVLTRTAEVHAAAWKEMFDGYLRSRDGDGFTPFDLHDDYDAYVDGKPRADGTRSFLESRGISLPEGDPDDAPDAETVHGLGNRKNELVQRKIEQDGVATYPGSVRFLAAVRDAGLKTAVVSSSANTLQVLQVTGLVDQFDERVDGTTAAEEHLPGKPAPDTFLAAARKLGVEPDGCAVFEDALAGVAAGHAGHFGLVVGVDRAGQADELRAHGADQVVEDLAELLASS
ncbi:HAD superfamily hydrolase (TIGR01509 family)/beta-phosphoglucomutase family hydrolase [Motilibacter rhizosphaerae]|uniref:Beta-phosphoglucomutase n=1 Tax=Motilibacter rhizosphaerae TaxID=598652 RepID=A0A4Q7NSS0_9ACTN|nr:beta-phosphoglucomutase family hydrolase [Motilibacter rhizosphaerae]RZS89910.1 HAD superfamily hydrolase (TIGR01509 family)/beta-phosphoglucomutase family hydrolase [Motilibacter rhizosphaerae]